MKIPSAAIVYISSSSVAFLDPRVGHTVDCLVPGSPQCDQPKSTNHINTYHKIVLPCWRHVRAGFIDELSEFELIMNICCLSLEHHATTP